MEIDNISKLSNVDFLRIGMISDDNVHGFIINSSERGYSSDIISYKNKLSLNELWIFLMMKIDNKFSFGADFKCISFAKSFYKICNDNDKSLLVVDTGGNGQSELFKLDSNDAISKFEDYFYNQVENENIFVMVNSDYLPKLCIEDIEIVKNDIQKLYNRTDENGDQNVT